jgi:hypothetical protein
MSRFRIDVDSDVFAYLEAEANSRIETHNTVLRRKLLVHESGTPPFVGQLSAAGRTVGGTSAATTIGLPDLAPRTPAALRQVLWVVHLVRANGRSRPESTADVARALAVTPQTVNDKYGRQMGLTADRFDSLLADPSLNNLEQLLLSRFPNHRQTIQRVLGALRHVAA